MSNRIFYCWNWGIRFQCLVRWQFWEKNVGIFNGIWEGCIRGKGGHCCRTTRNGRGFSGSGISSRALLYLDTLGVGLERVCCVINVLIILVYNVPVWVRHGVLIIPSINLAVFPQAEEILCDRIQDINSGLGFHQNHLFSPLFRW